MLKSQDLGDLCKLKNQKCRVKRHNGEYVDAIVSQIENEKITVLFAQEGKLYSKRITLLDFQIWNSFSIDVLKDSDKKTQNDNNNDKNNQTEEYERVSEEN
uniref:Doublecortin domain-containing protein n=1 Tax=Strongyloides stercoralis TaxID=6248 RepID=A0A0K0E269_STRER